MNKVANRLFNVVTMHLIYVLMVLVLVILCCVRFCHNVKMMNGDVLIRLVYKKLQEITIKIVQALISVQSFLQLCVKMAIVLNPQSNVNKVFLSLVLMKNHITVLLVYVLALLLNVFLYNMYVELQDHLQTQILLLINLFQIQTQLILPLVFYKKILMQDVPLITHTDAVMVAVKKILVIVLFNQVVMIQLYLTYAREVHALLIRIHVLSMLNYFQIVLLVLLDVPMDIVEPFVLFSMGVIKIIL